jgi:hypothetical protein
MIEHDFMYQGKKRLVVILENEEPPHWEVAMDRICADSNKEGDDSFLDFLAL